jgi:hypothetical protein
MRRDFDYMFLLKKTPKEFGLKVRTHPGVLKITAANKFRYKKIMYLSYSGELEQTYQFRIDKTIFKKNFDAVVDLISDLGTPLVKPINSFNSKQSLIWQKENNFNIVTTFLLKYKGEEVVDTNKIVDYINAQTKKGNLVNWTIAIINNSTAEPEGEFEFPGIPNKIGLTDRTNVSSDSTNYEVAKYNITDQLHELIDLTGDEIKRAKEQTKLDSKEEKNADVPEMPPSRKRIKWVRNSQNGLLLIYPLNHNCQYILDSTTKPKTKARKPISEVPVIGIAISFPEINNDEKIEYAVNEQFKKEYEYPEEFDQSEINEGTD